MDFNTELTKRLLQGDNINHLLKGQLKMLLINYFKLN